MTLLFDIALLSLVAVAYKLSKQPKKDAVFLCLITLALIGIYSYSEVGGTTPYWLAMMTELSVAGMLFYQHFRLPKFHDRMYYLALTTFLLSSAFITGFYIIDFGPYDSHTLYAGTSRALGITHVLFMLVFSDGIINSSIFSKMLGWFDNVFVWGRSSI